MASRAKRASEPRMVSPKRVEQRVQLMKRIEIKGSGGAMLSVPGVSRSARVK